LALERGARCSGCHLRFTERAWLALPLVETLTSATIAQHVVGWPDSQSIEIRRCDGCGRSIARMARAA
jgi:hypothetical protein